MVSNVLDYWDLKNTGVELQNEYFKISSVVTDTIEVLQSTAANNGVKINLTMDPKISQGLLIWNDIKRLELIFINFLSNAIKFSRKNTAVRVDISKLAHEDQIDC